MSNPVLPGFHPDPSTCPGGEDFYLVTSSFEYLPGVPIFHSRDLLHWEQIGNVLDRDDQLVLSEMSSVGVYAPTLRHHDGRFWLITTNVEEFDQGHLIVTATDPAGPWSSPVRTAGALGIDPDLAWDHDGPCYVTWAGTTDNPITQAAIDPGTEVLLSEPRPLWSGTGLAYPEAPTFITATPSGTSWWPRGAPNADMLSRWRVPGPSPSPTRKSRQPDLQPSQHRASRAEHRPRRPPRTGLR